MPLLIIVGTIALMVAVICFSGFVLSVMWGWFIVPVFGISQLSIPYAIGVTMIASFLTHQPETNKHEPKELGEIVIIAIIRPVFALLFGYIVTLFI